MTGMNRHLGQLMLIIALLVPRLLQAEMMQPFPATGLTPSYIEVGLVMPTPGEIEFGFGTGPFVTLGWLTSIGLIEVEHFNTTNPARADDAYNINQESVPGAGPTDYFASATMIHWGLLYQGTGDLIYKIRVGFANYEYKIERGNETDSKRGNRFMTFGAGAGWKMNNRLFLMLEYTYLDHLIGNANIGILVRF
jgi:hypothetical protein